MNEAVSLSQSATTIDILVQMLEAVNVFVRGSGTTLQDERYVGSEPVLQRSSYCSAISRAYTVQFTSLSPSLTA